jgi:hypothetical protein
MVWAQSNAAEHDGAFSQFAIVGGAAGFTPERGRILVRLLQTSTLCRCPNESASPIRSEARIWGRQAKQCAEGASEAGGGNTIRCDCPAVDQPLVAEQRSGPQCPRCSFRMVWSCRWCLSTRFRTPIHVEAVARSHGGAASRRVSQQCGGARPRPPRSAHRQSDHAVAPPRTRKDHRQCSGRAVPNYH